MSSYSVRLCPSFNITTETIIKYKTVDTKVGKITPLTNTKLVNNISFKTFDCEFYRNVNNDISINGERFTEYQEVKKFRLYYSQTKQLILVESNVDVGASFLKLLSQQENITMTREDFNFIKIAQNNTLVHQIWFTTDGEHVRSKGFNGIQVNMDDEAKQAILDDKATYIKVDIDVSGIKRTIGFSKKSAIVIINKNKLDQTNLELALETYGLYKTLI